MATAVALGAILSLPYPAHSDDGSKPPAGARDASCRFGENAPESCKVKIVSRRPGRVLVWFPEGRQSAMTLTYTGQCLDKGCILTGDDFGYIGGPTTYQLLEITPSKLRWRALSGDKTIEEIRLLAR